MSSAVASSASHVPSSAPRARWSVGVVLSIAAHVAMFGGALLYARITPPRTVQPPPIMAKLVRLGKPRPDDLLPRLAAPTAPEPVKVAKPSPTAPEPPATHEPAVAPKPVPTKEGKGPAEPAPPERDVHDALKRQRRLSDALAKLGAPTDEPTSPKGEAPAGREDGSTLGNAEKAAEGDRYAALVQEALRRNYTVPTTIPERERLFLSVDLRIFIAADGSIRRFQIEKPSGNDAFDRAVEGTLAKTNNLPSPPTILMRTYANEGLGIRFKP